MHEQRIRHTHTHRRGLRTWEFFAKHEIVHFFRSVLVGQTDIRIRILALDVVQVAVAQRTHGCDIKRKGRSSQDGHGLRGGRLTGSDPAVDLVNDGVHAQDLRVREKRRKSRKEGWLYKFDSLIFRPEFSALLQPQLPMNLCVTPPLMPEGIHVDNQKQANVYVCESSLFCINSYSLERFTPTKPRGKGS